MAAGTPADGSGPDSSSSWTLLVQCLTVECPDRSVLLEEAVERLRDTGATMFEAVVGAPLARYGPRVTLNPGPDPAATARRLGFGAHPWGPPSWYGLRFGPDDELRVKAYHRTSPERGWDLVPARARLPAGLPDGLVPQVAALDGDRTEVYFRRLPAGPWTSFAAACLDLLTTPAVEAPAYAPLPRPVPEGHCVSLSWSGDELAAVTLYAQDRCLPDDPEVAQAWVRGLEEVDRRSYEAALGAVRAIGRAGPRRCHGLLGWTTAADGSTSRAVSLRVVDAPSS